MPGHHHLQDPVLEQAAEQRGVEAVDRDPTAVPMPSRVADQPMEVSVRSQVVAPGLDGKDGPRNRAGPQAALDIVPEAGPGTAAELSQELTVSAKGRTQDLRNRPHQLPVVHFLQYLLQGPFQESSHLLQEKASNCSRRQSEQPRRANP